MNSHETAISGVARLFTSRALTQLTPQHLRHIPSGSLALTNSEPLVRSMNPQPFVTCFGYMELHLHPLAHPPMAPRGTSPLRPLRSGVGGTDLSTARHRASCSGEGWSEDLAVGTGGMGTASGQMDTRTSERNFNGTQVRAIARCSHIPRASIINVNT